MEALVRGLFLIGSLTATAVVPLAAQDQGTPPDKPPVVFKDVLTNQPMPFDYRPDQTITEAVKTFHRTAENPYDGDAQAITTGKQLYAQHCQACHLPSGKGQMGPSLIDDQWSHPGTGSDKGMFEIIYGGGTGAMQPFGKRIDQDQILKIMAYIQTLRAK
jgi:cytochrome c-L